MCGEHLLRALTMTLPLTRCEVLITQKMPLKDRSHQGSVNSGRQGLFMVHTIQRLLFLLKHEKSTTSPGTGLHLPRLLVDLQKNCDQTHVTTGAARFPQMTTKLLQ